MLIVGYMIYDLYKDSDLKDNIHREMAWRKLTKRWKERGEVFRDELERLWTVEEGQWDSWSGDIECGNMAYYPNGYPSDIHFYFSRYTYRYTFGLCYQGQWLWKVEWEPKYGTFEEDYGVKASSDYMKKGMGDFTAGQGVFLMEHLKKLYEQKFQKVEQEKKNKKEQEQLKAYNAEQKIREELRTHLQEADFWDNRQTNTFNTKTEKTPNGTFYTLYLNGKRALMIHQSVEKKELQHQWPNDAWKEKAFLESELEHIKQSIMVKEQSNLLDATERQHETKHFEELFAHLKELEKDAEWMTEEERHLVAVTYPEDLLRWKSVHQTLRDQNHQREREEQTVEMMNQVLKKLSAKVEGRKEWQLTKEETILKKRELSY